MPHVLIKHFPKQFSSAQLQALGDDMAELILKHFATHADAVSVALEPVEKERWMSDVYNCDIVEHSAQVIRQPNYRKATT